MLKTGTKRLIIFFFVVGCALAGAGAWLYSERDLVSTDDAMVDGHIFTVSARVSGYVTEVPVQDNQPVNVGDILVNLDPEDYHLEYIQVKADLDSTQQDVSAAEGTLEEAVANDKMAHLNLMCSSSYLI